MKELVTEDFKRLILTMQESKDNTNNLTMAGTLTAQAKLYIKIFNVGALCFPLTVSACMIKRKIEFVLSRWRMEKNVVWVKIFDSCNGYLNAVAHFTIRAAADLILKNFCELDNGKRNWTSFSEIANEYDVAENFESFGVVYDFCYSKNALREYSDLIYNEKDENLRKIMNQNLEMIKLFKEYQGRPNEIRTAGYDCFYNKQPNLYRFENPNFYYLSTALNSSY